MSVPIISETEYTIGTVREFIRQGDVAHGVPFDSWLANVNGSGFRLIAFEGVHTDEDVAKARQAIVSDRDVVGEIGTYWLPRLVVAAHVPEQPTAREMQKSHTAYRYALYAHLVGRDWMVPLEMEEMIATDAQASFEYARDVKKGPFRMGHDAIAKDARWATHYSRQILKDRFPEGERAILTDAYFAGDYARHILKGRWPEAEGLIAKEYGPAFHYARHVVGGPWPEGEKAILESPYDIYLYALHVLKDRWPEGEKALAANAHDDHAAPHYAFNYARDVVKGPWPEAEGVIARNAGSAIAYALHVLKGRFPQGEAVIAKDEGLSRNYEIAMRGLGVVLPPSKSQQALAAEAALELLAAGKAALKYLEANRPKGKIRDIFTELNQHENDVVKPLRAALDKAATTASSSAVMLDSKGPELTAHEPDPAAIFTGTYSLLETMKMVHAEDDFEAWGGSEGVMRNCACLAEAFEKWACANLDFERMDERYVYAMEDNFGTAVLTQARKAEVIFGDFVENALSPAVTRIPFSDLVLEIAKEMKFPLREANSVKV